MDARLDPAKICRLSEGDAHVIRNAGGRASDDAIRSLIISYKLLGTAEWFVIHHTDCGMETLQMRLSEILLATSLSTATVDANGWRNITNEGSNEAKTFPDNQ
jgi:carbonic anhydrase